MLLDLETISIGGGMSAQPILLEGLKKEMNHIFKDISPMSRLPLNIPEIYVCKENNKANLIGALIHHIDMEEF